MALAAKLSLDSSRRAVPDRQHRRPHAAAFALPQQIRPRLGRLPVPVDQRDHLLAAVRAHPDQHQQAQLGLLEADVDMDAVGVIASAVLSQWAESATTVSTGTYLPDQRCRAGLAWNLDRSPGKVLPLPEPIHRFQALLAPTHERW